MLFRGKTMLPAYFHSLENYLYNFQATKTTLVGRICRKLRRLLVSSALIRRRRRSCSESMIWRVDFGVSVENDKVFYFCKISKFATVISGDQGDFFKISQVLPSLAAKVRGLWALFALFDSLVAKVRGLWALFALFASLAVKKLPSSVLSSSKISQFFSKFWLFKNYYLIDCLIDFAIYFWLFTLFFWALANSFLKSKGKRQFFDNFSEKSVFFGENSKIFDDFCLSNGN